MATSAWAVGEVVSWAADYDYALDKETLTDYPLEQQASIIADYWLLRVYGFDSWHEFQSGLKKNEEKYLGNDSYRDIPHLYQKIVMG